MTFFHVFSVIFCTVGVCGIFLGTILATGSSSTAKKAQDGPTELDTELEAHIDSFEGQPHKNF
jgi:hypothetical protein